MAGAYSRDRQRIVDVYVEMGIPSDALTVENLEEFARRLQGEHDLDELRKAIVNLRKASWLPKLRGGHGPAKGSGGGHGKRS